jgi:replication factor C subunit 2/4
LEAIVFTSQGDMRQGLNNLQSTYNGFGNVDEKNVFKVCDEPHPMLVKEMLQNCVNGNIDEAFKVIHVPHVKSAVAINLLFRESLICGSWATLQRI